MPAPKATMRPADGGNATAAAVATATAPNIIRVQDENGRSIGLGTLSVIEEMRLLKILGEFNGSYYNFATAVCRVREIDGQHVPVPNSEREIEAVANRLGKAGIAALMQGLVDAAVGNDSDEREKDTVKKS